MKSSKRKIAGVLIISFLLYKKVKIRNIMISSAVFYSVALLAQGWHWVVAPLSVHLPALWAVVTFFQKILLTTRNGLFVRFPFLGMGMLIAFYKIEMNMKQ